MYVEITLGISTTRNEEIGNWKREIRKWVEMGNGAHRNGNKNALFLIKESWLSQLELVSEEVMTVLLEYYIHSGDEFVN